MEKTSQDINELSAENDIILEDSENKGFEDIQFEEVVDIDEVQRKLQEKIYEKEPALEVSEEFKTVNKESENKKGIAKNSLTKVDSDAKKYVIYVDPDNIDFMENLSVNERKAIINKILKEQNAFGIKAKELAKRKKFLTHAILACITFIVFFPLMFIGVNKSLMATINNYGQAKENFRKLYKEQGKIKMRVPGQVENIKY